MATVEKFVPLRTITPLPYTTLNEDLGPTGTDSVTPALALLTLVDSSPSPTRVRPPEYQVLSPATHSRGRSV